MVKFLRAYTSGVFNFATGDRGVFQDDVELALIAQGFATADYTTDMTAFPMGTPQAVLQGGNYFTPPQGEQGFGTPAFLQGPSIWPNIALGSAALTGYETNGVTQTAGQWNYTEMFVPYFNTWKGAGVLNGTTVGTSKYIVALWGSNGTLIANSAVAGTTSSGASVMQNIAFVNPLPLGPGRYFVGVQMDVATDTIRHLLSANGSFVINGTQSGTFGTVPNITTVSTTFTTAVSPICQLYTV